MTDIRLSNSAITSGTHTNTTGVYSMLGGEISLKWSNLVRVPPIPGKLDQNEIQSTGSFHGWENVVYQLNGVIEQSSTDSSQIHLETLKRLATNNMVTSSTFTQTHLFDDIFAPNGVAILVDSFDIRRVSVDNDPESLTASTLTKGTLLRYNMTVRETL